MLKPYSVTVLLRNKGFLKIDSDGRNLLAVQQVRSLESRKMEKGMVTQPLLPHSWTEEPDGL